MVIVYKHNSRCTGMDNDNEAIYGAGGPVRVLLNSAILERNDKSILILPCRAFIMHACHFSYHWHVDRAKIP